MRERPYTVSEIADHDVDACIDGEYVPARPMVITRWYERVHIAWGVLTGRYDALVWPKGQ